MATVDIQDATKSFGSTRVIRGVSIDIRDGEFVVLVGPRAVASPPCYA